MTVVELAAVSLAKVVVKRACTIWLGDSALASDATANVVEILAGRVTSELEKRRLRRTFEDVEDVVAKYLRPLMEHEFRDVPEHELTAAAEAVRATFDEARLTDANLFAMDLDAAYLDRHLRSASASILVRYGLSQGGEAFYDRMLRECCSYLIQVTMTLRSFNPQALTELIRRDTELRHLMESVLERLPQRRNVADFEAEYRQQVVTALDRIHLFGANVPSASRLYQLSVAYLSLSMTAAEQWMDLDRPSAEQIAPVSQSHRVEEILPHTSRLLILGDAGFGKTTLLQWIAVACATSSAPASMSAWNDLVPFFIPLRRYAESEFPPIEHFLDEVGRHIAEEKPPGWVKGLLRSGRAVVLIDGVDELPEEKRGRTRAHVAELIESFPDSHYVVTTRPPAVSDDWLKSQGFVTAELERMTAEDVRLFVHRWHDAMRAQCHDQLEHAELDRYESRLLDTFSQHRDLRRMAQTPLLCALICALHRERHTDLPNDRIHLYEAALDMMLRGREKERGISPPAGLGRTEQTIVLQTIGYWLIRNELSDAEQSRVVERIDDRLRTMTQVKATASEVFHYLLERTGLLRQPIVGRVDFIHRTFQEYLAARQAVEADDIDVLVNHAHLEQWREVVVMATGHARQQQRDRLLRGLLKRRTGRDQQRRLDLDLVAVACLGNSPDLDPGLRAQIESRARHFLPPLNPTAVNTLADLGEFGLDLLAGSEPEDDREVGAVIETAAQIGGENALRVIALYATTKLPYARLALLSAWDKFDPADYARVVLNHVVQGTVTIRNPAVIPGLSALRSLTDLICQFYSGFGNVEFLIQLPKVTKLAISDPDLTDLRPISRSGVQYLSLLLRPGSRPDQGRVGAVDLGTLAMARRLLLVRADSATVNWQSLSTLPSLKALDLTWAHDSNTVGDLAGLAHLKTFALRSVPTLTDLEELRFLTAPSDLNLSGWNELRSLDGLAQWSESLRHLTLNQCEQIDLATMPELPGLTKLDLTGTNLKDVRPLSRLRGLRSLRLDDNLGLYNLQALAELPRLQELSLVGNYGAQIKDLAGRESLLVSTEPDRVDSVAALLDRDWKARPISKDMWSRQDWLRAGPWDWRYEYLFRTWQRK